MKIIDKSLKLAYQLYPSSPAQQYYVFSFMFMKNKLISIGRNNEVCQCPKVKRLAERFNVEKFKIYSFPHSEIDCISKIWGRHYISGREKLVVIRLKRDGSLGLAKPCLNCQQVLFALNLTKVWYSTDLEEFEELNV